MVVDAGVVDEGGEILDGGSERGVLEGRFVYRALTL